MDTYTKDQSFVHITDLVAQFRADEPNLRRMPEAQIERNYVLKFLRYLNWNVDGIGLTAAQLEVLFQKTDLRGKRPDIQLRLMQQAILNAELKKDEVEIHAAPVLHQAYSYSYSTQSQSPAHKIDFAIVTNFRQFVLLDCTLHAATPEVVQNFIILDWTCEDYVTQFDTLWNLFERENVRAALATRNTANPQGLWSLYLSPKKVKANRIPPDRAFLADMDDEKNGWRAQLAKNIKKLNPDADGALITATVQLWIDRLVFIKALSDREIEEDYLAQLAAQIEQSGLGAEDTNWFEACRGIFAKLNQFYNGGIFAPRPELEALRVSNKVLRDIVRDLQLENSPYNFSVMPVEILGTIYERFLGRVVRTTDHRVKIEDKPAVRKAGGVYYTPQYIVDYIVQNTVGKLLEQCATPEDVAKLKILDPACGSGSFLLGAYQALIDWHKAYYAQKARLDKRDREAAYYNGENDIRLTAKLKRQILLNNIFGVDIDAQAVEVTHFSLSLKALEETRQEELRSEVNLFKQTVLPDLGRNIKCGNSLIGSDYITGKLMFDKKEMERINPFDWDVQLSGVLSAGGFDCVIGNPPYGATLSAGEIEYLTDKYKLQDYQLDSYVLFLERSLGLLKAAGRLGMIIPNTWVLNLQSTHIRQHLFSHTEIQSIVHYRQPVFKATVDTEIIVLKNCVPDGVHQVQVNVVDKNGAVNTYPIAQQRWQVGNGKPVNILERPETVQLADKLRSFPVLDTVCIITQGAKPFQVGKGKPPQTRAIVQEKPFVSERKKNRTFRPLLRGSLIDKYQITWNNDYWISFGDWLAEPRYSASYDAPAKIVIRQTGDSLVATLDRQQFIVRDNLYTIVPRANVPDLCYVLGLLNSRLLNWFYQQILNPEQGEALAQVKRGHLAQLPIALPDFANPADGTRYTQIVKLVEMMLEMHIELAAATTLAKQNLYQNQITSVDRLIDKMVYELYGLTPEEIALVENQ